MSKNVDKDKKLSLAQLKFKLDGTLDNMAMLIESDLLTPSENGMLIATLGMQERIAHMVTTMLEGQENKND